MTLSRVCKRGHASSALPGGRGINRGDCKECNRERSARDRRTAGIAIAVKGGICKRGHASSLLPGARVGGACRECKLLTDNASRRVRAADPAYRKRVAARVRKHYATNPSYRKAMIANATAWNAAHRDRARAQVAKWRRENPGKHNAKQRARTARKLRQICTCCNPKDVAALYVWAQELGLEVDHRQALRLGGLHCLDNLEALTPEEHKAKTANWDAPLIATARRQSLVADAKG